MIHSRNTLLTSHESQWSIAEEALSRPSAEVTVRNGTCMEETRSHGGRGTRTEVAGMSSQQELAQAMLDQQASRAARRILIVDDEPKIRSFVGRALTSAGYLTDFASNGADGLRQATKSNYDLIILDLVMPGLDGQNMLDRLLSVRPEQAIIMLSCVADVSAKVECLEHGAQDYLTKPFSLAELLARVRVRLREDSHLHEAVRAAEIIKAGEVTLDVGRLVANVGRGPVPLTRLEFLLLRELAEHVGESVPKDRLLATVWGYDFDPGSNVVDVCVRRLRSKLGFDLIKTVRGEGYQLVAR